MLVYAVRARLLSRLDLSIGLLDLRLLNQVVLDLLSCKVSATILNG
jgi:hypothetical protein